MDIIQKITQELKVEKWQVEAAVKLIDEGNTIPFISRYRKEVTGALNDEQLRNLSERLNYLRNLEDKKNQVLSSIEEQGKLTEELKKQILEAETLVVVEDLYRPYRPKRRTRATIAKEKGLEPLANILRLQTTDKNLEEEAQAFISEEKEVKNAQEALAGAMDIVAESISDEADYRIRIRKMTMKSGLLVSSAKKPEESTVYDMYYEYEEPVSKVAGHRVLAINRGEKEKILTVKIQAPEEDILRYLEKQVITRDNPNTTETLKTVVEDSYRRLIAPAIEREIRSDLTEKAEDGAIKVFKKNLEQLLMQPPIEGQVVLGWDPAFRTGCKLAVVDPTGKVLDTTVIYPTAPTTPVSATQVYLGRPWHNSPKTVFLNTRSEVTIYPAGWYYKMNAIPAIFADYNTMDAEGNPVDLSNRIEDYEYDVTDEDGNVTETVTGKAKNSLTDEEAAEYTYKNVLSCDEGWNPSELMVAVVEPQNVELSAGQLTWDVVDYARCYVVFKDNHVIGFTTSTSYTVDDVTAVYHVKAANEYGSLSEFSEPASSTGIGTGMVENTAGFTVRAEGDVLIVGQLEQGQHVQLFSVDGRLIYSGVAVQAQMNIPVSEGSVVYLISVNGQVQKVLKF